VGGVTGIVVYVASLYLLREVSLEELRAGWGMVRGALGRLRPAR
jgi:hypothetical protein